MKDKLKAAVYGLAIGDALGVPVEFKKRGTFHVDDMMGYGTHQQPAGTWSDDTSMTLATCDSIRECGTVDCEDMLENFRKWLFNAAYTVDNKVFDAGGTTVSALRMGKGMDDIYSNGNGSLMRVIPLAFIDMNAETVSAVSAITHANNISMDVCCEYVSVAKQLLDGKKLTEATQYCSGRIPEIHKLDESEIKSTGFVVDTFEAAVWAVATTDNYKDAVLKAVNLGDDTDTVAAVAGGLAGIMYGMEGIPAEWVDNLRGKEVIDRCLF